MRVRTRVNTPRLLLHYFKLKLTQLLRKGAGVLVGSGGAASVFHLQL
jgi:hypothetical protein